MIAWFIDLLAVYLESGICEYILYFIFGLAFLATVPRIIHAFFRR